MKAVSTIIKSFKIPALFIFFSYLVLCACYNLGGADYLFHTKAGEYISASKTIPKEDIFSFTMSGKSWVDHEWLYQVLVYHLHHSFGLEGLFLFRIVVFSLIFFLLATMLIKANWLFGFPLLVYGLQLSLNRFTIRPDNLSLLFLVAFLLPFVFKKKKLLILLPFIQLFWVNIHGFFFLGPVILALYLILSRFNKVKEDKSFYNTARIVFIGSVLACFLTPQPLAVVSYPFKVIGDVISGNQGLFYKHIQELESPLSNISKQPHFFIFIALSFICLCFFKSANWFYLGLGAAMLVFSMNSLRNMYFFIPVAIAIFVDRFPVIKEAVSKKILKPTGFILLEIIFIVYLVNLSLPMVKKIINFPKLGQAYITEEAKVNKKSLFFSRDQSAYPEELIEFMRSQGLPREMFNSFNLGAAMIFNFFPERKVFIDGRAEFYGQEFFSQYRKILNADQQALDEILEKHQIEGFVLSYFRDSPPPLIKELKARGFECVYFGQKGIIFVSPSFLNNNLKLKQHRVNFDSLALKKLDLFNQAKFEKLSPKGYLNMAKVLKMLDYPKTSQEYLEEVLRVWPGQPESYYQLALIDYEQQKYQRAFISCRQSLLAHPSDKAHKLLAKIYLKTGNTNGAKAIAKSLKIELSSLKQEAESE